MVSTLTLLYPLLCSALSAAKVVLLVQFHTHLPPLLPHLQAHFLLFPTWPQTTHQSKTKSFQSPYLRFQCFHISVDGNPSSSTSSSKEAQWPVDDLVIAGTAFCYGLFFNLVFLLLPKCIQQVMLLSFWCISRTWWASLVSSMIESLPSRPLLLLLLTMIFIPCWV